jgi:hypothetical protein
MAACWHESCGARIFYVCPFWHMDIGRKAALKMLLKFISEELQHTERLNHYLSQAISNVALYLTYKFQSA